MTISDPLKVPDMAKIGGMAYWMENGELRYLDTNKHEVGDGDTCVF
jgi:hypothetical protein